MAGGAVSEARLDYMTPRLERWRRATDGPLLVLAIGSLPLLLLELKRNDLALGDRVFLDVVNAVVLVAFAVDYAIEVAIATNRGTYIRREWTSAAIVVSQALAVVPALGGFGVLRVLRGARAFRAFAVLLRPSVAPQPARGGLCCVVRPHGLPCL